MKTVQTILLALISILTIIIMTGCSTQNAKDLNPQTENYSETQETVDLDEVEEEEEESEGTESDNPTAVIETTMGTITAELYADKTPNTVNNFVELSKQNKYNDVPFHRVIRGFMIQTGDFENKDGTGGYTYRGPGTKMEDEFHPELTHEYGALSMANAGPNTNGSQFFIVQSEAGTPWLNGAHSVFGQVIDGLDVVEAIAAVETGTMDRPVEEVSIVSVTIQE